jgi:deoxyribodipyrimidine photo-lyase
MKSKINVVWFKRDFRLEDHAPLHAAVSNGLPTLFCAFFEPSLIHAPEYAARHWRFQYESIVDLNQQLLPFQAHLYAFHAAVEPTLQRIQEYYDIQFLFSHQETGLKITFDRDVQIKAYCQKNNIHWQEFRQDGVFRGLGQRINWEQRWQQDMEQAVIKTDLSKIKNLTLDWPDLDGWKSKDLPLAYQQQMSGFQPGGATFARRYWQGFLKERAQNYNRHISKPALSRYSCSRLSPYIAYGNISIKEIFQVTQYGRFSNSMQRGIENFQSRIWWRSHFMQKLESEWQMEFEPLNRALKSIDRGQNEVLFHAWATGQTGMPMVDANMRCLQTTGWINFRMRAMLTSYATFTLWLDWKMVALHLAQLFTDFEPGIHYSQVQMQAGLTGYHTLRVYNPTTQSERHDSAGTFVHQWVPELKEIPIPQVYEPWKMPNMEQQFYRCQIGIDYPAPIVDFKAATSKNKDRYWAFRQAPEVKAYLPQLWSRHCSPKSVAKYKMELDLE